MSTNEAHARCSPKAVAAVLSDGWYFASWVVGTSRVRSVDASWPAVGATIHHSFGVWPVVVDDTTEVLESALPEHLVVQARGWPLGEATVRVEVRAATDGCTITMQEDATAGPGTLVPQSVRDAVLRWRNSEALNRLVLLAEGHADAARPSA